MLLLFLFTALFMLFLLGRLSWLQLVRGEWLRAQAMEVRMRDIPVEALRGPIVDRNHRPLALSVNADSVYAMPPQVKDPVATAQFLSRVLGVDYANTLNQLTQNAYFVYIKRKISPEESKVLRDLKAQNQLPEGIDLTQEGKRVYPNGQVSAHVLGIVGTDRGWGGLEYQYEDELKGRPGRLQVETDAFGEAINGAIQQYIPPRPGDTLVTTIDENIQFILERDLQRSAMETKAKRIGIIAVDPRTGDILGMAMTPGFDPGNYQAYPEVNRRIWLISDPIEPGSMFKPVVAAGAMEEGLINSHTPFYAPGSVRMAGYTISNWDGQPVTGTLLDVVAHSSNTGFMQIGLKLGKTLFYKYLRNFGLTELTGIDLPGEATGLYPPEDRATDLDIATMSFGQTLTVTPLQMVSAIAAIGNDGKLMRPRLVREIRDRDGKVIKSFPAQVTRQVISKNVARELSNLMEKVISEGTGKNAYIPGYKVAGKTGTAEKLPRGSGKYIADFLGFGPVEDPRIAITVIIDEPQGIYYGGQIAAPLFKLIMGDVLRYLEIPPTVPLSRRQGEKGPVVPDPVGEVPQLLNLPVQQARREAEAAGFSLSIVGGGPVVTSQLPPAGTSLTKGATLMAEAGGGDSLPDGLVTVPDVKGKTIREAGSTLGMMNLRLRALGSGVAVRQNPAAGQKVPAGSDITVEFTAPVR